MAEGSGSRADSAGSDDEYQMFEDFFDTKSVEELRASPDVDASDAAEVFDYAEQKKRAKISKLTGENEMRSSFFDWASKLAGWVVGLNMAIFIGYMLIQAFAPGRIPDAVMLSWIAGTVVEILGIVAIVARHLFPGRKWQTGKGTK